MNLELQSTLFSQSLYVPQTQEETKEAHKPPKSLFPLAKNLLERLPEVDKYNPMINREMVLKYTFNKLLMDIEKNFKDTDFNKSKAPFLPHSFEVWRREAWEKLVKSLKNLSFESQQHWKRKFVSKVDGDFLIRTFRELKEPYFNLIFFDNYHMPKEVKESGLKKDENLCSIVFIGGLSIMGCFRYGDHGFFCACGQLVHSNRIGCRYYSSR